MRQWRPGFFDPQWYLEVYPDVAASGMDPLRHYLRYGRQEGRRPCALVAADRARDLNWGLLEGGVGVLEALSRADAAAERAWAAVALARHRSEAGAWPGAAEALAGLDPGRDLIDGFGLLDPALLASEAALVAGDRARARRGATAALRRFGPVPDVLLALANLAWMPEGPGRGWRRALILLYAAAGLRAPWLGGGGAPAFDRLDATAARHLDGPLVTVIVPVRDAAPTIATALRGLTQQSWRALDIVVVDNGSTDATADEVRRAMAADARIRLIDGAAEPGAYAARNLGLAAARGAFVTVHDADDWSHPAKIALQVRALLSRPEAPASLSSWVRATPDLRFTRWWGQDGLVHPNISSLMIRIELRERLGYWDRVRGGADTEYCDRIRAVWGAEAILRVRPRLPLAYGRRTEGSLSRAGATAVAGQRTGARRSYHLSAGVWHREAEAHGALPLPRVPDRRPFPAPPALGVGDPEAPLGAVEAVRASGLYDDDWTMRSYSDLRITGKDGVLHYLTEGAAEGRDPGPEFSTTGYCAVHGGVPANALERHLAACGPVPCLPDLDGALPAPEGRPRILFFAHQVRDHVFGAERSLLDMLDRAAAAGAVPSVVVPQAGNVDYLGALRANSHRVHVRPYGWLYGGVAPPRRTVELLTALIRDTGAAEVHVNTLVLEAPLRAAHAAGIPATVHVRELPAEDPQLCRDLGVRAEGLRRHLLDLAPRFVANSDAVARWVAAGEARVTVVPNRVDHRLAAVPFAPGTPPRVGLIGSLAPRKGVVDAIAAARGVAAAGGRAEFVLIGPDAAAAALAPLPANMRHAGYAADAVEAMAHCDVVLSLSHFAESFGRTVAEALTAGRPVICYDRGTPPDLVGRDGRAGRVVPAGDVAAVLRAVCDITGDAALLTRMSAAARERGAELARREAEVAVERIHPSLGPGSR
ncbi:glycosyltransferase [Rhodobacteraceae bacterium CCMM004]|nr:glycosyltransferase [Rhodobacteraceae bacterium CCMM004]